MASYDFSTNSNVAQTATLQGGKMYYLQAIASKRGGGLSINLNTKMYNSTLNGKTSSMVKTEVQAINIQSKIIQETTV